MKKEERSGAQALVDSLAKAGTEILFGYPGGAVLDIFDVMKDALINYPLTLIEPYKTVAIQAFDGIDGFDADSFGQFLVSEVTTQLWSKGYQSFLKNFLSGSGNEIAGAVVDVLNNKISGKGGG